MAGIDRTTILTGPALVTYGGQSFWSKGDVTVKPVNKRNPINVAAFGKVDERFTDKSIEVSFEPSGAFTAGVAAVLWPYAATVVGASIFPSTDSALVVWSRDGKKLTLPNAALTQMPNIRASVGQTIAGAVKFTGILAKNTDPATAGAYYTLTTASYPGDAGFAVSDIKTLPYTSAWGSTAPWSSFETEGGWDISFTLGLTPQLSDSYGTVDMRLKDLGVSAKAIPIGPTESDVLGKITTSAALGSSIQANANQLLITGGTSVYIKVYNASLVDTQFGYGPDKKRIGQSEWIATRSITTGTPDPLFYIGTTAPA